ncbi:MAG: acyl carrier protein [Candidatus Saganbacteria bacterium]|nr:acyl carrier protein [Candidatus Saganbacteria bacterium]
MTNDELRNDIRKLVAKIIKLPEEKITFEADLFSDLGVDSLSAVAIFAALDKQYGIEVPEERLKNIRTLNDLAGLAARLIGRR